MHSVSVAGGPAGSVTGTDDDCLDILTQAATATVQEGSVDVSWTAPDCPVDRYLVWAGAGERLVAVVSADGSAAHAAVDGEPWPDRSYRYWIQAEPASGPDAFDADRAVTTDAVEFHLDPQAAHGSQGPTDSSEGASPSASVWHAGAVAGGWIAAAVLLVAGLVGLVRWRRRR